MTEKLYLLDDGHGMGTPGKRTDEFPDGTKSPDTGKNFMHENEFNRVVVKYLAMHLNASGIATIMSAPTDADTSLEARAALADAKNVDGIVSVHANALTGIFGRGGRGIETYVWMGGNGVSEKLGRSIHKELITGTSLVDRGVKKGNHLFMIRIPKAPSVLVECGFMDDLREAKLLLSDAYRRECAEEIARGICKHENTTFVDGLKAASAPVGSVPVYRVRKSWDDIKSQKGAFAELQNAKDLADAELLNVYDPKGRLVYTGTKEPAKVLYRVRKTWVDVKSQKGAFYDLNSAKRIADEESMSVFDENGKSVYVGKEPTPAPKPTPPPAPKPEPVDIHKDHVPIMGESVASKRQMVGFLKEKNPSFVDAEEVADAFLEVGKIYGVKGDIAFCQSLIETGWFKFDGGTAVTPDQHNYCGMGVTSKGLKGNSFETVKAGVTAQIQHLYAYASKEPLPEGEINLDPRFHLVSPRGVAPHWEDLSMKWAMNENYGAHILAMYKNLMAFVPEEEPVDPIKEILKTFPSYGQEDAERALRAGISDGSNPDGMTKRADTIIMMGRFLAIVEKMVTGDKE